jgi:CDP-6-deoxy-D-xylo-4-hexulose-3-dehydrase
MNIDFNKIPYINNNNNFNVGDNIYYSGLYWNNNEIESIINSVLNGKWISSGEKVRKFEILFSKKFNVKYSKMVNSGSSANLIMINALKERFNWKDNDEIIVSPVGFPTTISVIYQNKLKPIFIDIEMNTLNFDINKIEEKITKKTRGIFVSPVLGNPPDMNHLLYLSNKYNLILIGDNCDSLGSKWDNKYLNEYYYAFSSSFYPAHHISTGEGGMVSTNDYKLNKIINSLVSWGRDCYCIGSDNLLKNGTCKNRFSKWLKNYDDIIDHKYVFNYMGYNFKPLDLQGSIGIEQLKKIDDIIQKRKNSKKIITDIFINNIKGINSVKILPKSNVSWFGTPFICDNKNIKQKIVNHLENNKIQTRNYFAGNILLHDGFSHLDDYTKYPNANTVLDKVFFVGASPLYNNEIFEYINNIIKNIKL